jgi:hypothetical protein
MAKKTLIDSKLLETIDDQIYKHLPIDKLKSIVKIMIDDSASKILGNVNTKINERLSINTHLTNEKEGIKNDKPSNASRKNRLKA